MRCPGCREPMRTLTVEAVLGATAEVNACAQCRAFWFVPYETLHLTRASTLQLFKLISENPAATGAMPDTSCCPQCGARLFLTHDRQNSTPFQYWRCDAGHGRFTSFVDFLREKEYIRPLTPQQIAQLKQYIRTINCSSCGAPVAIAKDSVCAHCGTPLSLLDMPKLAEVAKDVAATPSLHTPELPSIPTLVASVRMPQSPSLVDLGLQVVRDWLERLGV